jgi:6-pyruvoyltetrahydropterin/6-carboxytetrahydropterin synthase
LSPATRNPADGPVLLWRKAQFAAAHFLALPELSEAENLARFGPSSNPWAHGHNYEVEIGVSGMPDPATGMVVNLKDLKTLLAELILSPLDFKNLNQQVPFFKDRLPTLENLAQFIWAGLSPAIDALGLALSIVRVSESVDLFVEYCGGKPLWELGTPPTQGLRPPNPALLGETLPMQQDLPLIEDACPMPLSGEQSVLALSPPGWVFLSRRYTFPAGHRLYNPDWDDEKNVRVFRQCNNPNGHGHNYELEVTVGGCPDPRLGMVTDLYSLDQLVQRVLLDRVDHKNLNLDVDFLAGMIPTAENIVRAMWGELAPQIQPPTRLVRLRLVETPNNAAEYRGN